MTVYLKLRLNARYRNILHKTIQKPQINPTTAKKQDCTFSRTIVLHWWTVIE
jgi:hypothetical protein